MVEAFYRQAGDAIESLPSTRGPWHPDLQHAGPPAALLGRALETDSTAFRVTRVSIDLLKPVPITTLRVECSTLIGGRRRQLREARLLVGEQTVALARAMLLRTTSLALDALPNHDPPAPPPLDEGVAYEMPFSTGEQGYHKAMELRVVRGGPGQGQGQIWMRQRIPLLAGEAPSQLQRVLLIADSGNGISSSLDWRRWRFTNPDLTINLRRPPLGDWLCLDAHTHFQDDGLGMAESRIWDHQGVVGNGTQNLLLEPGAP